MNLHDMNWGLIALIIVFVAALVMFLYCYYLLVSGQIFEQKKKDEKAKKSWGDTVIHGEETTYKLDKDGSRQVKKVERF